MPNVMFDKFWEEVRLYCASQPKKSDMIGIVLDDPESAEAQAWIAYCHWQASFDPQWYGRARFIESLLMRNTKLTLPCANPSRFDPEYQPKGPIQARPSRKREMPDPETRRRSAEMARRVASSMRPKPDPKSADWQATPKSIEEIFADMEPPKLSDRLAAKLGLTNPESKGDAA